MSLVSKKFTVFASQTGFIRLFFMLILSALLLWLYFTHITETLLFIPLVALFLVIVVIKKWEKKNEKSQKMCFSHLRALMSDVWRCCQRFLFPSSCSILSLVPSIYIQRHVWVMKPTLFETKSVRALKILVLYEMRREFQLSAKTEDDSDKICCSWYMKKNLRVFTSAVTFFSSSPLRRSK